MAKRTNYMQRYKSVKNQLTRYKGSAVPRAMVGGATVLAGAGLSAAIKAALNTDEIAGVDAGVVIGLIGGTAGAVLGKPMMITLAAGAMAPYVHDFVYDSAKDAIASVRNAA